MRYGTNNMDNTKHSNIGVRNNCFSIWRTGGKYPQTCILTNSQIEQR